MAPSLRVAAQIGPYFVVGLDLGATKAFGLRLRGPHRQVYVDGVGFVWPNFRSPRCPPVYVDTP